MLGIFRKSEKEERDIAAEVSVEAVKAIRREMEEFKLGVISEVEKVCTESVSAVSSSFAERLSLLNSSLGDRLYLINSFLGKSVSSISKSLDSSMVDQVGSMTSAIEKRLSLMSTSMEERVSLLNAAAEERLSVISSSLNDRLDRTKAALEERFSTTGVSLEGDISLAESSLRESLSSMSSSLEERLTGMEDQLQQSLRQERRRNMAMESILENQNKTLEALERQDISPPLEALMSLAENFILSRAASPESAESAILYGKLANLMECFELAIISETGVAFDPSMHEACEARCDPLYQDESVLEIVRPGFLLRDKVLRCATVVVNRLDVSTEEKQPEEA